MGRKYLATIKEICHNIYHIDFPTQHLMCSSLIRFEEHYESPKFKGKVFSLEELVLEKILSLSQFYFTPQNDTSNEP